MGKVLDFCKFKDERDKYDLQKNIDIAMALMSKTDVPSDILKSNLTVWKNREPVIGMGDLNLVFPKDEQF